ncbi:ABC transporter permease [Candidatus Woesearchaeota archaeon]|nr:ABC transporter permease [Candidatus Woesearchaeota archaeon]
MVTSNAVKAYVSDLNERIGTEFILDAWKNLRELNNNLRFLVENLERAAPVAEDLKNRLDSIRTDIESVDFDSSQQTVSELISFLNLLEIQLNEINNSYALTAPAIPNIPQFTYTPNASIAIKEYRIESDFWRKEFCNATKLLPITTENPICTILDHTDEFVDSLESDVTNLSFYRDDINNKIQELNNRSAALNQQLENLAALISSSSEQNAELKQNIDNLRKDLLFLEEKTENMTRSIDELEQSLNQFLTDIVRVTRELNQTIEVLDSYTEKDPSTILRPVKVDAMPVFKDKLQIFYKLPALISIILLFIILFISSSLIVNERRGGTMARIFLSPISMFFYVFEKMLYLLLLSLLAVISMIIAAFLFRVPITISLNLFLVFIIASLVYISIGILIGSVSKSENTSLLTCLVIGFPLMFLSGAFSAPELMSQLMRAISQYLPLTMHIGLLENLTIYHTGLDMQKLITMAIMILVFYILSVLMIKKKPTLK